MIVAARVRVEIEETRGRESSFEHNASDRFAGGVEAGAAGVRGGVERFVEEIAAAVVVEIDRDGLHGGDEQGYGYDVARHFRGLVVGVSAWG